MHTIKSAVACLAVVGCALAAPTALTESIEAPKSAKAGRLAARASYWIQFWKDVSFTGENIFLENQQTGVCYNLPGNWNDKMSSVQVSDGHSCRYWKDSSCTGSVFGGTDQDWAALPSGFSDQVTYWRCS
ncbi:hypothetical protein B0J12DRAFT_706188 [Macrophomina phaseolina]|uniref:Beta/gamma crystallin n=1 Tax=Macrophomina phaseolina TaxID=35725 RepID=A0ABQ8FPT0_9PEZI|nr:hypothetical protein B0J12DRAFT_706188 [Macrophomina phaseolina]